MALRHEIYQALGDPTRLQIIERLGAKGETSTLELVSGLGMSRQAATKHLVMLEQVGLVTSRTDGRSVYRTLRLETLGDAGDWLRARAAAWESKLDALARFVESAEKPRSSVIKGKGDTID